MDKYLTYSVVERKDPQNPEVAGKFYAQAQARGEAGIRELSQRIQQTCTVTLPTARLYVWANWALCRLALAARAQ